jgi:hypothetical protein
MSVVDRLPPRLVPRPGTVALVGMVLLAEAVLTLAYVAAVQPGITRPFMVVLVPFVWINLSLWVFWRVRPAATDTRRWPAAVVAAGYFLLLALLGGIVVVGSGDGSGLDVMLRLFPGWAPFVVYDAAAALVVLVPFKVVGYLALTYLVYVTAVDASGALVGGIVGLFSCVSCTFPLIAGIVTSLTGGSAIAAAVSGNSYLLSTPVFALTVALLAWQPSVGTLTRVRESLAR